MRYLKRQALAEEGSPGQNPDDVFIGIFALIVVWGARSGLAPMHDAGAACGGRVAVLLWSRVTILLKIHVYVVCSHSLHPTRSHGTDMHKIQKSGVTSSATAAWVACVASSALVPVLLRAAAEASSLHPAAANSER